jgi:CBS domain-containing protein
MKALVSEYMNRTLVYLLEGDRPDIALRPILELGITAVPVLDAERRPVGIISIRDLADQKRRGMRVTEPAMTVDADAFVSTAGVMLAETGYHHLIVVDVQGKAIGIISSLDVVRAFCGLPPKHPEKITKLTHADRDFTDAPVS